jgi:hypothetical protein
MGASSTQNNIALYHASTVSVEQPVWNYAVGTESERNDFGLGFYTSTDFSQPLMLLCDKPRVVLNKYELSVDDLSVKYLKNDTEWLLTVAFHRRNFNSRANLRRIRDAYRESLLGFDVVVGAVANDRLFSTINAFIENNITDAVATACLDLMHYEPQYVLKSDKACERASFMGADIYEEDRLVAYRERVIRERALIEEQITQIKEQRFREGHLLSELLQQRGDDEPRCF